MFRCSMVAVVLLLVAGVPGWAQDEHPGKAPYDKWCAQCHGENGDGQGIATPYLKPEPRDFTAGKYKVRSTPTGSLPTDADLERAIRKGLPYSAMPAFPASRIGDGELRDLIAYLKTFSPDFEDPEATLPAIDLPSPPPYDRASAETQGREVYEATGCARCHGERGRGDGMSAPTLVDDWGKKIRTADLSMPWTFRGGGTRRDIFRTMSTGFFGTPMPGFHGALPVEDIWAITDYMVALADDVNAGEGDVEAPYANVVRAIGTDEALDLARGEELFAASQPALFPVFGQIVEPGRNFYPSAIAVEVRAIYNRDEIAFEVAWHDMRAETAGSNAPDLQVPAWDEQDGGVGGDAGDAEDDGDVWGDDVWGDDAVEDGAADDDADDGGDFWGEDAVADDTDGDAGDDFWGDAGDGTGGGAGGALTPDTEFSDAVAIQFPQVLPEGVRKPYFIFGDAQNPVELWHADLGAFPVATGEEPVAAPEEAALWIGRGSAAVAPGDGDVPEVVASYRDGRWSVIFKRKRASRGGVAFPEAAFVPIAFTTWDGFNRERGNKRGLTAWYDLYLEPLERPSPLAPMLKAFFGVLGAELLLIGLVRYRRRKRRAAPTPGFDQTTQTA